MSRARIYVISGLPASGKSSLGRELAARLALPLFDKDDILEALFDALPPAHGECVDAALAANRQRLSRASDVVLRRQVNGRFGAVVVSFWRHPGREGQSGTPVDWLLECDAALTEVHCICPPKVAMARFDARKRHPGHRDGARGPGGGMDFAAYAALGPLGVGRLVTVDTSIPVDIDRLIADLSQECQADVRSAP